MAKSGMRSVNISTTSSKKGLREEYEKIAKKQARTVAKVVAQVYYYAVEHKDVFPKELKEPREKPGRHIATTVTIKVAQQLTEWANALDRNRASHCCFILEYVLEDESLRGKIFN